MEVEARIFKPLDKLGLKKPRIVVGFPSTGLVGSVSLSILTKDYELLGFLKSDKIAPVAAIHEGKPLPPIRILYSKEHNVVVFLSEISVPISLSYKIAQVIEELYKRLNASELIIVGGMFSGGEKKVMFVASNRKIAEKVKKKGIKEEIMEGALSGVPAIVMFEAFVKKMNAVAFLVEADPDKMDVKAVSLLLKALSSFLGIPLTVKFDEVDVPQPPSGMYG